MRKHVQRCWCVIAGVLMAGLSVASALARADEPPPKVSVEVAPRPRGADLLKVEAQKLASVVESDLARAMLRGVDGLPRIEKRVVYRSKDRTRAYSETDHRTLVAQDSDPKLLEGLERKEYDEQFYYFTGYGSPLVYARVLDVLSKHGADSLDGKRLADFGYGTIGHLRLMAGMGCFVQGIDVEPVLAALYSDPIDQGIVARADGRSDKDKGYVWAHRGRWPKDDVLMREGVGPNLDVFTSKNTLKRGYIHPEREVDERFLVKLGVSDAEFVKAVHDALKPGGLFVIYNIAPAQNPPDKAYLPHADGRCPFPREMLEHGGFEVLAFDQDDASKVHEMWNVLGYDEGKGDAWLKENLFAMYTVARKRGAGARDLERAPAPVRKAE